MARGLTKKGDFNIGKAINKFNLAKRKLPMIIANDAANHFIQGFRQGGGQTDAGTWQKRKKDPKGAKRGILIFKGRLWKSVKVTEASFNKIAIASVGIPYAARHNEGLGGMPKREFLGESKKLNAKVDRVIRKEIKKVFA